MPASAARPRAREGVAARTPTGGRPTASAFVGGSGWTDTTVEEPPCEIVALELSADTRAAASTSGWQGAA